MTEKNLNVYINTIKNLYYKRIKRTNNKEDLKELYKYVKDIIPSFYINKKTNIEYEYIIDEILKCERLFKEKYIIESNPIDIKKITNYNDLDLIVYETRDYISKKILPRTKYETIEELKKNFSFVNYCTDASSIIKKKCGKKDVKCKIIIIYPGYSKEEKLYNGYGLHAFNIIELNNDYYIVDITYRQFFEEKNNIFERVDILGLDGCKTGFFMLNDEIRKKVAKEILTKGYIRLTEESLKAYLDGFTMSYRNGLYYDKIGDFSFKNGYDIRTYGKFLSGEDNQINHEGRDVLGFQKKPSKVKKLYFN